MLEFAQKEEVMRTQFEDNLKEKEVAYIKQIDAKKAEWKSEEEKLLLQHKIEIEALASQLEQSKESLSGQTAKMREQLEKKIAELTRENEALIMTHLKSAREQKNDLERAQAELFRERNLVFECR